MSYERKNSDNKNNERREKIHRKNGKTEKQ